MTTKKWYLTLDHETANFHYVDMFKFTDTPNQDAIEWSPGKYFHDEAVERSEKAGTMLMLRANDIGKRELRKDLLDAGIEIQ